MKLIAKYILFILIAASIFTSCKKENQIETDAPAIADLEIGTSNSKVAYPGSDVHLEAKLTAPGNIATVKVQISPVTGNGWILNKEFTEKLAGLKNATLHEHIDVPADAKLGQYKVTIEVTDQNGKSTKVESALELKQDLTLPQVTGFEVVPNATGTDLHVEAKITAVNKIAKIVVEIHGASWKNEYEYADANIVGQTAYTLHKHINITDAPAGHYHVHLNIKDQAGKAIEFEEHFDKK